MTMRTAVSLALVLLALPLARVEAQSAFVGAGVGVAATRVGHQSSESPTIFSNDVSGDTYTWSITAGTSMTRRGVLQMEYGVLPMVTKEIPPSVLLTPCPSCGRTTTTVQYRSRRLGVLIGYTAAPSQRFSVSALGGVAMVNQWARSRSVTTTTSPTPPLPFDSTYTNYLIGPEFGLDAAIGLSRHLRVVPQARIYRMNSFTPFVGSAPSMVTTASVDARWYF